MSVPSLATRARRALDDAKVPRGATILVACSGGLDSQVLLDVLAHLSRARRVELVAHGVDHGLRAEATEELALAAGLAASRGVPFSTSRVAVGTGSNLQARAREARWHALRRAAEQAGASFVATGHHADDRAETVLIRLLRGAPIEGLAVLPVRSKNEDASELARVRPLIRARKSEIAAHATTRKLPFADDPSNRDRRHLRVRVRHELLPLLQALDPRIVEHLCALADQAAAVALARPGLFAGFDADLRGSSRAVAALRDAVARKNVRARVPLAGGRIARWDETLGVVISSTGNRARKN